MVQQYNKPMCIVELFDSAAKKVMVAISFCCEYVVVETETYKGVNSTA